MPLPPIEKPPAEYRPDLENALAWCPYCGRESEFWYDARLDNARCSACGASERDYHVRRCKRLWNDKALEAFVAGAAKSGRKWVMPYPWEKPGKN